MPDEFLEFKDVKPKLSQRPDLHAFLLLDQLCPGKGDIIACAEHDEFWLDVDVEELAKVITKEQVIDLVRCGVRYDKRVDSLAMFA